MEILVRFLEPELLRGIPAPKGIPGVPGEALDATSPWRAVPAAVLGSVL